VESYRRIGGERIGVSEVDVNSCSQNEQMCDKKSRVVCLGCQSSKFEGYALVEQEFEIGLRSLAVPVLTREDRP
jgi:hypothetical protein